MYIWKRVYRCGEVGKLKTRKKRGREMQGKGSSMIQTRDIWPEPIQLAIIHLVLPFLWPQNYSLFYLRTWTTLPEFSWPNTQTINTWRVVYPASRSMRRERWTVVWNRKRRVHRCMSHTHGVCYNRYSTISLTMERDSNDVSLGASISPDTADATESALASSVYTRKPRYAKYSSARSGSSKTNSLQRHNNMPEWVSMKDWGKDG